MLEGPLGHELQRHSRHSPLNDSKSRDLNSGLMLRVSDVEVRGLVVIEIHADHNPEEPADLRHERLRGGKSAGTRGAEA